MLILSKPRRGLAVLLLAGSWSLLSAGEEPWKTFETAVGGVRLEIPEGWFIKEIDQDQAYQAFLSREKVEKEGDLYTYGVSIMRLRNYRKVFSFKSQTVDEILLEYANQVAANLSGGETAMVIALPASDHGLKLQRFQMMAGRGPECLRLNLLAGLRGKQWVHALWEIPCSEAKDDARTEEIAHMIKTFYVEKQWGPPKK